MISHDIPDVFFISNRILALYDRQIVFQGTPEEPENFEHPLTEEIIDSLENFTRDFQKKGLAEIEAAARAVRPEIDCFEFSVYVGSAKGQPNIELASITEIAEFMQKPIGRFQSEIKTEGPTDLN